MKVLLIFCGLLAGNICVAQPANKPNIVVVVVDQWRAQATGFNGNKDVLTPHLDQLAKHSVNVKNAVSGMPVCTPFRAQLLTGRYPLSTGVFMNDVMLDTTATTIANLYKNSGYATGFIGKWHIDGHGRNSYIPENRRQGFEYFKALECTHNYNHSAYYAGNDTDKKFWEGYDVKAQSHDAQEYIIEKANSKTPFMLFLSLGPPHDPYPTAPEQYKAMYADKKISIDPNVPAAMHDKITKDLKDYYAHISAIDDAMGSIVQTIQQAGIENNTLVIFTADHGDLMGAHGQRNKQQPYAESIKIPFLIHYPQAFGNSGKTSDILLNSPDIMPTILGLTNMPVPSTVEGYNYAPVLLGKTKSPIKATLITCVQPFGQWSRDKGGREYRGVVTQQYTYVRDLKGPWLLFDNTKDPYQLNNLVNDKAHTNIQRGLEEQLQQLLAKQNDQFKPGMDYVRKWNYVVDETETVPYVKMNYEGKPVVE